ncbi:MAG: arginase [Chitinophagaceae bacterium]|nr:MAG: arginase [Chitinophagaceae bacterium]
MSDSLHLADFLEPVKLAEISNDEPYHDGQVGKNILLYDEEFPDLLSADLIIIGCPEQRGKGPKKRNSSPDNVRSEFYRFYNWHQSMVIADAGNIRSGADLDDTYAALKTVISELNQHGKTVVIIGGSHDLTLAQYNSHADSERIIEAVCVDAKIDLDMNSPWRNDNFLMEMLTSEPNFIRHYNHIGFQSYLVHPHMLETLDKLRFDCYRVGKVRDNVEEMEPVIRNADIFSFDISAIAHAYAPANAVSPNGFTGDEACAMLRFAGLAPGVSSVGIYGYDADRDDNNVTAKQISQMIWYFIEGRSRGTREARINEKDAFNEYHTAFAEVATTFLQSKRTGRWWMQLPDQQYIACSYNDYIQASSNEIPERWLRAQERSA